MAQISHADLGGKEQMEFEVTITKYRWDKSKPDKSGKESIILAFTGTTKDGRTAESQLWMNNTPSKNKKYPNMTEREVAYERCYELGMEAPFSPHKVDQIIGTQCIFVMEPHSYMKVVDEDGKKVEKKEWVARVKFINTFSRPSLSTETVVDLFRDMFGEEFTDAPAATAAPAAEAAGEAEGEVSGDPADLPF